MKELEKRIAYERNFYKNELFTEDAFISRIDSIEPHNGYKFERREDCDALVEYDKEVKFIQNEYEGWNITIHYKNKRLNDFDFFATGLKTENEIGKFLYYHDCECAELFKHDAPKLYLRKTAVGCNLEMRFPDGQYAKPVSGMEIDSRLAPHIKEGNVIEVEIKSK